MKCKHWVALFLTGLIVAAYFILTRCLWIHHHDYADYFIRSLAALGTVGAIWFALFKDSILGWLFPVELRIEVLGLEERNQHLDVSGLGPVYCHHLRVTNLTRNRAVENCSIWLKSVIIKHQSTAGQPDKRIVFAVPQLMEWAPSEFSRQKRTFGEDQILDLGQTAHLELMPVGGEPDTFMFTIDRDQGAAKELLNKYGKQFIPGAVLECVIYATADNYHKTKEFRFRILVKRIKQLPGVDMPVEASEVSAIDG